MPVYVYKNLTTCETFEVRQPITAAAWTEHPETGDPVKRIVQPVGIAFKGSGFYVNDSRGSKPGVSAGDANETGNGTAKDGTAKDGSADTGAAGGKSSEPATPAASKPAATSSAGASAD